MSYDIRIFRPIPEEDPLATARSAENREPAAPNENTERLKRHVAEVLMANDPQLKPFHFDYEEIARYTGTSIEDARARYRHIELNSAEAGLGIQITIFDDSASVTVPYWHTDPRDVQRALTAVWNCLSIIVRETGSAAYDPQLDRLLDLSQGYEQLALAYLPGAKRAGEVVAGEAQQASRPWWKFW
jgi:hypothetical protein